MADALVSLILERLGSIVLDGIAEEVRLIVGVKQEIKSLTDTLTIIQEVLQDAEDKQVKKKGLKFWLEEFKDISYDAEDILDEWNTISFIQNMQHSDLNVSVIRKVGSHLFGLFSCFKPIVIRHDIGNKIKELNERLVGVVEKKQSYNLSEIRSNEHHRQISSDLVDVAEIYGRDADKDVILSKLLDESSHQNLHVPVISIVGTGGFGKTTLAQLILKQTKELTKFDKHMWVCVSYPFNLEKVAKEIIEQAKGIVPNTVGWPALQKILYESVHEKHFILVLDDVWSYDGNDWWKLKLALDGGAKGSRILITTRDERVAIMMDSSYTHLLGQLLDGDCWSLFKRIAFSKREDDLDKFEYIGKAISKKCKGVPLAVRVIASLMRFKRTRQDWRDVLASDVWKVQEGGEGFLPSILRSYYALPSYLKACLMYCAVFPKDSDIQKEAMVQLWMAQGYLGSHRSGSADLEMIGRGYFDNLAMLSFFQDFERDDEGKITGCKMHDLVHDFVQFLTKNETIILEDEIVSTIKFRHLCARDLDLSSEQKNLRTLKSLPGIWGNSTLALKLIHQLTCLRALSLCGCDVKELPSEVDRLLHLRYLNLSDNDELVELPETVCNLHNLLTLDLSECRYLIRLPKGIAKLSSSLRHLHVRGCVNLNYMPLGVGKLRWLRTLEKFIVGGCDEESKEQGCTLGELQLLNHLEGRLKIKLFGEVALAVTNAAQAELHMKEKLRSLKINFRQEVAVGMEGILEHLQPHANLEKLKIKDYGGIRLPDWISSLSNLTELVLRKLRHCLQLPALGKLPSLEVLELDGLDSVKSLGSEFYGLDSVKISEQQHVVVIFRKLKKLKLSMEKLEEWDMPFQNGIDFFPNLRQLRIDGLYRLRVLPALGKLKSLETLDLKDSFVEFLGIPTTTTTRSNDRLRVLPVLFPSLTYLGLYNMSEWEEVGCTNNGISTIMPGLSKLEINNCPKLKTIPFYMFSRALRDLSICSCPQLKGLQPCLPLLLENLELGGDVGVLNSSLPVLHNNHYPNLNRFETLVLSQSSLPQGFNLLTSIRELRFHNCKFLNFGHEDLKHLTILEQLEIKSCPILAKRFGRGEEISSSSSHSYKIDIYPEHQDLTKIEGLQLDVNVHIHIGCDNCEMNPMVGKRYRCKDCWDQRVAGTGGGIGFDLCEKCYNTPSKHTDLVKQSIVDKAIHLSLLQTVETNQLLYIQMILLRMREVVLWLQNQLTCGAEECMDFWLCKNRFLSVFAADRLEEGEDLTVFVLWWKAD